MRNQNEACEIQGDFRILKNGDWLHDGQKITRLALVQLFSTILKQDENGQYWLQNPVEKVKVTVEEAPFIITQANIHTEDGIQSIHCISNIEEHVTISAAHPLILADLSADGLILPYLKLSSGLLAKLSRPVYYQLVDLAAKNNQHPRNIGVWSQETYHILGEVADN